jgi:catechol-2,3-dioxygenase
MGQEFSETFNLQPFNLQPNKEKTSMTVSTGVINHFALTVTDKDRAREFYTSVLNFQFITEFGPKYLLSNDQVILAINESPD